ncbi:LOW QUALITY PROTEIN: hypothetical protein IFM46972_04128 [Aspergillus udagawae]|uniref:Rhodopsin domain-containing protein n=1 Tax=Aspergillus udagawae TaxID=91492 RepID=A0A8H3RQJ8_9EURO|nr:LOW QUALITY PROTEIN: hypothetical protein IFM46972_04128 [Aspergillus udagawae]
MSTLRIPQVLLLWQHGLHRPHPGWISRNANVPIYMWHIHPRMGLAVVAVLLRLLCRTWVSKWDDYMICIALVSIAAGAGEENTLTRLIQAMVTGEYVDMIIWVYRGVGGGNTHLPSWDDRLHELLHQPLYLQIFYTLSICLTKNSILMF